MNNLIIALFGNVGKKIKQVAILTFFLEIIAGIILSIALFDSEYGDFAVLLIFLASIPVLWFSCLLLYGFGQLIENTGNMGCRTNSTEQYGADATGEDIKTVETIKPRKAFKLNPIVWFAASLSTGCAFLTSLYICLGDNVYVSFISNIFIVIYLVLTIVFVGLYYITKKKHPVSLKVWKIFSIICGVIFLLSIASTIFFYKDFTISWLYTVCFICFRRYIYGFVPHRTIYRIALIIPIIITIIKYVNSKRKKEESI